VIKVDVFDKTVFYNFRLSCTTADSSRSAILANSDSLQKLPPIAKPRGDGHTDVTGVRQHMSLLYGCGISTSRRPLSVTLLH